ncbi:MAG: hypothetical protein WBH68_04110 [Erysipelotrichaceae bacterium]|jgi:hypothetical protein|nr:hypothetical protein [Bacillota bacterium]NLP22224.1 hypothetical protein [Erysipelotrichaceae bacterium]
MRINDIINNVEIYGFESSIKGSKYPMSVNIENLDEEVTTRTIELASATIGEGHDNFMNGIIVQFDLTFTNKAWVEAERYNFLDFISSQSAINSITKFDMDNSYINYVDSRIIEVMKDKILEYNDLIKDIKNLKKDGKDTTTLNRIAKVKYLEILYSNPAGFKLTARMTTNYRQLKTIYKQRRYHVLPEWQIFCDWVETLPYSDFITRKGKRFE